ncbi:MAG: hypothetical protein J6P61_07875 [Erysipelotrichaceae bacterium]|nr:hypothetical protein [Erysipelotrichaceae bacterium]
MLHLHNPTIKAYQFDGEFGLEKESLRVNENGHFAKTRHPFENDQNIVKDFAENQTEINTEIHKSAHGAIKELEKHQERLINVLKDQQEYLWRFSNPPYIENEEDIPIAIYSDSLISKYHYRQYLSHKYGRYLMTFSGIHVNFSFGQRLLDEAFQHDSHTNFQDYKNNLYLHIAKGLIEYGWILVTLMAASPIVDGSYFEQGVEGQSIFTGMASLRCSELGYWNEFIPILDYSSLPNYVESIQKYLNKGLLSAASELYYPIRLKPAGVNRLDQLLKNGVNHIELRMYDLNPFAPSGVDEMDLLFAQRLILYLADLPPFTLNEVDQVRSIQNFKKAARYDLDQTHISSADNTSLSVREAALNLLDQIKEFFDDDESISIIDFQRQKLIDDQKRYAARVKEIYGTQFQEKALALAKKR